MKLISANSLIFILLIAALSTTYSIADTSASYFFIFIIIATGFSSGIKIGTLNSIADAMPFIYFLIWIYGLILGVILGNDMHSIFRNFFGMSCYIIYYVILNKNYDLNKIWNLIFIAAIINAAYFLFSVCHSFIYGATEAAELTDLDYSTDAAIGIYRLYWSVGITLLIGPIGVFIVKYFSNIKIGFINYLIFSLMFFSILGTFSKGFILELFTLTILLLFTQINNIPSLNKIKTSRLIFILFSIILFFTYALSSDVLNIFASTISSELIEGSRNEQRSYILNEISIFGNGMGASLHSGYKRDDMGYSFELNFENLIHKIGIFSIFIFGGYILTLVNIIKCYLKRKDLTFFALNIGLMLYLIPAYGNPILFSPTVVIIHCLVLYMTKLRLLNPNVGDTKFLFLRESIVYKK